MRERWSSKTVFVMAAIGSAVGLGNIWRFPYLAGKYGGGSFLLPYLILLILIGIPMVILEFSLGEKMQKGAVKALGKIKKPFSIVGYTAVIAGFVIVTYYAVIIAWSLIYFIRSFTLDFKDNTQDYFFNQVLHLTPSVNQIGSIDLQLIIALAIIWILVFLAVFRGIKSLSRAIQITLPIPIILLVILVIRGLTLPGSVEGILLYLKPEFSALFDIELWSAAIAQAFFSLSVGYGTMLAYASFESKKSDITKNAFVVSFADFFIALLAGFAVFSTLGYMAAQKGVAVASLAAEGPGLAFIVLPQSLLLIPGSTILSIIFFLILITLGLSSAFSIIQAVSTPITDIIGEHHEKKVAAILCTIAGLLGILYTTGAGMYFIDIIDHYITSYPILLVSLFECIAVGWFFGAKKMRNYVNKVSDWKLGRWWDISIRYITPALLLFLIVFLFIKEVSSPYGGYPAWALAIGWGIVALTIGISIFLYRIPFKKKG